MKAKKAAFRFVASILALATCVAPAAADSLADQLNSHYLNKVLMLRHFYKGDRLSFQPDGSLIGAGEIGPWTTSAEIYINKIELAGNSLQIQGRRVCLTYDDKTKSFNDVLEFLELSSKAAASSRRKKHQRDQQQSPDWEKLIDDYRNRNVAIEIALGTQNPGVQEASTALTGVFIRPGESMANIVPEFWQNYFDRAEGRNPRSELSSKPIFRVEPRKVYPPRVIYSPEPEFSGEARSARYQGIETLALVVDDSGKPTDIQIVSPLGLGLDEKAVDAVRKWKFEPAKKDGNPVSVRINVELDFHLY